MAESAAQRESGGCVRGKDTNSRPSAWPLPRKRTTRLYGDRWQGPGGGNDQYYTATFRSIPSPGGRHPSTLPWDVDEVPGPGGSRPDRLAPVSGTQEPVQGHFAEQLVEPVRGVLVLDAPLGNRHAQDPSGLHSSAQAALRAADGSSSWWKCSCQSQRSWRVARTSLALNGASTRVRAGSSGVWDAPYTRRRERPFGFTASPGRYTNTGQS